jgi:membrane fusion protein (multidrug efflux system)
MTRADGPEEDASEDDEEQRGDRRRGAFVWLILAAFALAVLAVLLLLSRGLALDSADETPRVAVVGLEAGPVPLELPPKVGLLEAAASLSLSFEVTGRVARILGEGARAKLGEELAALDSALEAADLQRAELLLADAQNELTRVRGLKASEAASESALDSAVTAVALRRAERDAARERLHRRALRARFDGVVTDVRIDPGEVAVPGAPIANLENFELMLLEVGVPGHQVGEIAPGDDARVTIPALPGETFEGTVHHIAPSTAAGGALFDVEILVPNLDLRLRPGMSARSRIVTDVVEDALVVPLEAVVERAGSRVVFFLNDAVAHAVAVDDATLQGDRLVVPAGHGYRDLVVRGQHDLVDGMEVQIDNSVLSGLPMADWGAVHGGAHAPRPDVSVR